MRQRVLLVAGEMDLRARFARELHLSGYAVELACDENRALRLAAAGNLQVAIVAPGPSPTSLAMMLELRDTVPKMIVLAEGPDEIARLRRLLPGVDEFLLKSSNEGALTARVGEMMALADNAAGWPRFCRCQGPGGGSDPRRVRPAERNGAQSLPGVIA